MPDFLLEIGLEEVPARMLASAQAELELRVREMLGRERLIADNAFVESFSTPRRLAVLVHGVAAQQADWTEDLLGPPIKAAYKDGQPTPAAHAFGKKAGIGLDQLRTVTNTKGEYLAATITHPGKPATEVIAAELPREIAAIYWAKTMYWRAGKPERFVRPLQWLVALLGTETVPLDWAGKIADRCTYGHRILHGPAPIRIDSPATYKEQLRAAHVLVDVEERRHHIRKALDHVTRTLPGAHWREDHELVDKVTHLTEWPTVLLGSFDPEYLQLPEEVLVTVMRDHQNYFAPEGPEGKLLPNFLTVLNIEPGEAAAKTIQQGNERVLRARFNDARFFYDFDQRTTLVERIPLLANITFQKDLGNYAAKSERVRKLATYLAEKVRDRDSSTDTENAVDLNALREAAALCKTDLTTELVKEFTELQGIVGGLYARAQGISPKAARAIYDHYRPVSADDPIPYTVEGQLLSIADKADTIAGMFSLGLRPTGSRDPFALRRAANGIVRILAGGQSSLPLSLHDISFAEAAPHGEQVAEFLAERLEAYLHELAGTTYDAVRAVMATHPIFVRDTIARVRAVAGARNTPDFVAVCTAFKRIRNILDQAKAKGYPADPATPIDAAPQPEDRQLDQSAAQLAAEAEIHRTGYNYPAALEAIATLRHPIDNFFEKAMVMDPHSEIRAARLGLLQRLLRDFSSIADFSEIVSEGRPVS